MASWNGDNNGEKDLNNSKYDPDDVQSKESLPGSATVESSESSSKLRREENPFSFRHFLSWSNNVNNSNPPISPPSQDPAPNSLEHGGARAKTRNSGSSHFRPRRGSNSSHSQRGLPDFVQDHLDQGNHSSEHSLFHPSLPSQVPSSPMPFDLTMDQPSSLSQRLDNNPLELPSTLPLMTPSIPPSNLPNVVSRSRSPIHAAGDMPIPFDLANCGTPRAEVDLDVAEVSIPRQNGEGEGLGNGELSLPDFLSDGPMQNGRFVEISAETGLGHDRNQWPNVLQENAELRTQLESIQISFRAEREKVQRLEAEIEERRRRDTADTTVMESVVGQIDSNLRTATERAVVAETQVSSLRLELRRLENEINALRRENEALRGVGEPSELRTGMRRTASELNTAANQAERSVRELLSGVEYLRILAATLESLDRPEDVSWHKPKKPPI